MSDSKVIATTFLHSVKVNNINGGGNAVVVSELLHREDGTQTPNLRRIIRPKRSFWVTKPQFRNHDEKKVIEKMDRLDQWRVLDSEMDTEIFRALNGYYPRGKVRGQNLYESPYLYGANIDIQSLIKSSSIKQRTKAGVDMGIPTVGFLDIERSIDHATLDEITIISVTHENKVYTAINKAFFYTMDSDGNRHEGNLEALSKFSRKTLDPLIEKMFEENEYLPAHRHKLPIEYNYFVGYELDCIKWIFEQIHRNKTSFVGIWNMDYDIPAIVQALEKHNVDPKDVFCPKELPEDYRYFRYARDEKPVGHPSEKWHWLYCAGYTQFYDAMCLYAKLRTVNGKESSYALDHILTSNGIEGKLKFPELEKFKDLTKEQWHIRMTREEFYRYIVYNQADVVWIQLMEWLATDALSMVMLSGVSPLEKFPRQTKKVQDTLFSDWIDRGYVLGTTGKDMSSDIDDEIGATGGAVLNPNRMDHCGLNCLIEYPTQTTLITGMNNDVDFSSMYPTTEMAGNIGTDTKLSTVITITGPSLQRYFTPGDAVEAVFGYLVSPLDNAMHIGVKVFGLFTLEEMAEAFTAEHGQIAPTNRGNIVRLPTQEPTNDNNKTIYAAASGYDPFA